MKVFSAPQKVTLNITNRCNLNCLYCAVSSTKNAPGDLTLAEWKALVDELALIKVFHLLISGGEPFVRSDFAAILKHILQLPFRVSINTNGTRIDRDTVLLLAESNRLDNIQISLDGPAAKFHDSIRGHGSFGKMMKGIQLLQQYEIPFSFFVVVCRNNLKHLKEIVLFSKKVGATHIAFCNLLPQGSAIKHFKDLNLSFGEQKEAEAELGRLKKEYPDLVGGSLVQTIEWMNTISRIPANKQAAEIANKITSCGGSISECSIRPEGWVIPCDRLWDCKVGSVREDTFQSIWLHSEGFRNFRTRYARRLDSFEECKNCHYTGVCRGGCPAIPFNLGKGIDGWDPLSCYRVFSGQKKLSLIENQ
ncbi:MAG: radical SAM protein [Desulfobacterales bacterium]|jgi:SynChlorMet cassette radical SAM/SPASM protein ScmE